MCAIIFIAKIPLQFQIKPELPGGICSLDSLPGLCPGPVGHLGDPQTPCLTRKETLVTAFAVNSMYWAILHHDLKQVHLIACTLIIHLYLLDTTFHTIHYSKTTVYSLLELAMV
jgi:hypothetical protein